MLQADGSAVDQSHPSSAVSKGPDLETAASISRTDDHLGPFQAALSPPALPGGRRAVRWNETHHKANRMSQRLSERKTGGGDGVGGE